MQGNLVQATAKWIFTAVCLATMIDGAMAGAFTRGCAARDLQILKLIEERQFDGAVSDDRMSDAMFTMVHARMICHQGRVLDAHVLYDRIIKSIAPRSLLSDRGP